MIENTFYLVVLLFYIHYIIKYESVYKYGKTLDSVKKMMLPITYLTIPLILGMFLFLETFIDNPGMVLSMLGFVLYFNMRIVANRKYDDGDN